MGFGHKDIWYLFELKNVGFFEVNHFGRVHGDLFQLKKYQFKYNGIIYSS